MKFHLHGFYSFSLRAVAPGLAFLVGFSACGEGEGDPVATSEPYQWALPPGFPTPRVPPDNHMSAAKVELGRYLFYDTRLSGNETFSCGSCHKQALAFTDSLANAVGSTGEVHRRNSMGLTNVGYNSGLTWANPLMRMLEDQALGPMFGEDPVELGPAGREDALLERLRSDGLYQTLFPEVFPDEADPFSIDSITKAISSFERTLISGNSPYDRYFYQGQADALSESAKRGMTLFFSEKLECYHCHAGFNFTDSVVFEGTVFDELFYHNTALYNVDDAGSYPAIDTGLFEMTGTETDMGRFRVLESNHANLVEDASLTADAWMPSMGHGMNTTARVTANGDGTFLVENMEFSMTGEWEILLDVTRNGMTETATFLVDCCD